MYLNFASGIYRWKVYNIKILLTEYTVGDVFDDKMIGGGGRYAKFTGF